MSEVACEACHLRTTNCSGLRLVRLKEMYHCTITSDILQVFVIACVPCTQMISTCLLHVTSWLRGTSPLSRTIFVNFTHSLNSWTVILTM